MIKESLIDFDHKIKNLQFALAISQYIVENNRSIHIKNHIKIIGIQYTELGK